MSTHGEKLVLELLESLEYEYFLEPIIAGNDPVFREPDFVIIAPLLGVLVLEVKDWKRIRSADQRDVEIQRNSGEIAIERNPVRTAKKYATNLADQFQRLDELLHNRNGKKVLKFPWLYAVALPNIDQETVEECSPAWGGKYVLSKEQLTKARFPQALAKLDWAWKLQTPLDQATRRVIEGAINPKIIVRDKNNQPVGIQTLQQEGIINEPLKPINKPSRQTRLPLDVLSNEAKAIAENTNVRLVRGVAGSGKSLVLAQRAQFLAEKYPELKILILAFNVHLVADLNQRIPGAPNLEVTGFHKICSRILGGRRDPSDLDGWVINQFEELIKEKGFTADFVAEEIEYRKELGIYKNEDYLNTERKGRGNALNAAKRAVINIIFDRYLEHHMDP
jgi:hypothetical protein